MKQKKMKKNKLILVGDDGISFLIQHWIFYRIFIHKNLIFYTVFVACLKETKVGLALTNSKLSTL